MSIKHSIPGNFFPSINSSDAPPPVDICVILSSNPAFLTAAAESPPPIIVVASKSANTFAIAFVPIANCGNSNTPKGPFHITVFAFCSSSLYSFIVSSPISNPSQSGCCPSFPGCCCFLSSVRCFPFSPAPHRP